MAVSDHAFYGRAFAGELAKMTSRVRKQGTKGKRAAENPEALT